MLLLFNNTEFQLLQESNFQLMKPKNKTFVVFDFPGVPVPCIAFPFLEFWKTVECLLLFVLSYLATIFKTLHLLTLQKK